MSDITDGLNRLAYQFKGSTKLEQTFSAALEQFEQLRQVNSDLELLRYLDTSFGAQLDGVGEIVGLPRPLIPEGLLGLFGFLLDTTAQGFGDANDPDVGGNFWDGSPSGTYLAGDDLYRLLIRAKIIKNQTAMTVDDTTRLLSFMFGGVPIRYFFVDNFSVRYDIGKYLDDFEVSLLSDLPTLICLNPDDVEFHTLYDENSFSFFEDPDGLGFGDATNPDVGGTFAKVIV